MSDAPTVAGFNVALAKESENLDLQMGVVRPGVEAVLGDPAKGVYFVAEEGGQVIGQLLVTYEWSDWRNGNFWWLQSVYVHPKFRSRGVFKSLFDYSVTQAKKAGNVCGFRLYVETHNQRAQDVYYRLGLKKTDYHMLESVFA